MKAKAGNVKTHSFEKAHWTWKIKLYVFPISLNMLLDSKLHSFVQVPVGPGKMLSNYQYINTCATCFILCDLDSLLQYIINIFSLILLISQWNGSWGTSNFCKATISKLNELSRQTVILRDLIRFLRDLITYKWLCLSEHKATLWFRAGYLQYSCCRLQTYSYTLQTIS